MNDKKGYALVIMIVIILGIVFALAVALLLWLAQTAGNYIAGFH